MTVIPVPVSEEHAEKNDLVASDDFHDSPDAGSSDKNTRIQEGSRQRDSETEAGASTPDLTFVEEYENPVFPEMNIRTDICALDRERLLDQVVEAKRKARNRNYVTRQEKPNLELSLDPKEQRKVRAVFPSILPARSIPSSRGLSAQNCSID